MTKKIRATFDGKVFRPEEPIHIPPNSQVLVTIEYEDRQDHGNTSFLKTARSLDIEGPRDWSSHLDEYLYGSGSRKDG
jgi:hypothetical protein